MQDSFLARTPKTAAQAQFGAKCGRAATVGVDSCSGSSLRSGHGRAKFSSAVEEIPEGYRVLDANDRILAYVAASDQPTEDQSKGWTRDEAWRIASVISSLPELIKKTPAGHTKWSWLKWLKLWG
jgi:hypothetical protein